MKIIDIKNTKKQDILKQVKETLLNNGLFIYPTETTYGIGALATQKEAIDKLLSYKSKRQGKPMSIVVHSLKQAQKYVHLNDQAIKLYKTLLPGPYTIVSKSKNKVDPRVQSDINTLGIRIPDFELILDISKFVNIPFTATSANASGKKRPYSIKDIFDNISLKQKQLIDLVLDAGTLPIRDPSVVIDTTLSSPIVLRKTSYIKNIKDLKDRFELNSPSETIDFAKRLMLSYQNRIEKQGLIIMAHGSMGAGKTTFAKGIGQFLNIKDNIRSPSFNILNEYKHNKFEQQGFFYHIDAWRIDDKKTVDFLNLKNLIGPRNIVYIEWFENINPFFDFKNIPIIHIYIFETDKENKRYIKVNDE